MIPQNEHQLALNLPIPEYYHEIQSQAKYTSSRYLPTVHIGQRKLLISEVHFLNLFMTPEDQKVVIYAGSAEGMHLGMLLKLYPGLRMILIDPSDHYIRITSSRSITHRRFPTMYSDMKEGVNLVEELNNISKRLFIYKGYMTDELTENIKQSLVSLNLLDDLLFISDIRTASGPLDSNGNHTVVDKDIVMNQEMQMRWRNILDEPPSLFKTRCKFYHSKDADVAQTTLLPYVAMFLQPWAPIRSIETRAILNRGHVDMVEFDNKEYEEKMNVFNMMKGLKAILLPINLTPELIDIGFCSSWDCWREATIWQEYLSAPGSIDATVETLILTSLMMTARNTNLSLIDNGGGMLFADVSYVLYTSMYRKFIMEDERRLKKLRLVEIEKRKKQDIKQRKQGKRQHSQRKKQYNKQKSKKRSLAWAPVQQSGKRTRKKR